MATNNQQPCSHNGPKGQVCHLPIGHKILHRDGQGARWCEWRPVSEALRINRLRALMAPYQPSAVTSRYED